VDGCTFLALFGLFVAQLTGSYVVAGVLAVSSRHESLIKIIGIPLFFFFGVATTVGSILVTRRGRRPLPFALGFQSVLLIAFLVTGLLGTPFASADAPLTVLTGVFGLAAMGVQSALVRLLMRGVPSTNVMTTNTTQIAIDVGEVLVAACERRSEPLPQTRSARNRLINLLPLAAGFAAGTVGGAIGYTFVGLWCILAAIVVSLGLWVWSFWVEVPVGSGND
jgi:uncharacterized membrane protein YoaK (UPF0700 family)